MSATRTECTLILFMYTSCYVSIVMSLKVEMCQMCSGSMNLYFIHPAAFGFWASTPPTDWPLTLIPIVKRVEVDWRQPKVGILVAQVAS